MLGTILDCLIRKLNIKFILTVNILIIENQNGFQIMASIDRHTIKHIFIVKWSRLV
jgi:hypothetical protein